MPLGSIMVLHFRLLSLLPVVLAIGCAEPQDVKPFTAAVDEARKTNKEVLHATGEAIRYAETLPAPKPRIELPDVEGWTKSERRALPADDDGFTVAYDHSSGLAVTLYQFTRGLPNIANDLRDQHVQLEMERARNGIQQGVQLGVYSSARETENDIVRLGHSRKHALWSRYAISVANNSVISDTYVWPHNGAFFKIRCTGAPMAVDRDPVLHVLLTALGNACEVTE